MSQLGNLDHFALVSLAFGGDESVMIGTMQATRIRDLEAENKRLREALEFYADLGTWKETAAGSPNAYGIHDMTSIPIWEDNGDTARDALAADAASSGEGTGGL